MPVNNKLSRGYRLLLKVCNMMLKANRDSISVSEMEKIGTNYFGIRGTALVHDLVDNGFFIEKEGMLFRVKANLTNGEKQVTIGIFNFFEKKGYPLEGITKRAFIKALEKYKEEENKRINPQSSYGFLIKKELLREKDGKIYLGVKSP